ncbi:MAG: type II secretion system protein N [Salinisphaera sp.]|nr:type II secretion system protein N [Salinisphaera sp.]
MKWALPWVAGLLSLAVGLVVYMPAQVAVGWAEQALPGLRTSGVHGSLLDGSAAHLLYHDVALENTSWTLHPLALLRGRLAGLVTTATDSGQLSARAALSLSGRLSLNQLSGSASLKWLARRAGYSFLPVAGLIGVDVETLSLSPDGDIDRLNGRVQASGLRWQLLKPPPLLGDYVLALHSADSKILAEITDSSGPLALAGKASLSQQGVYQLDLRLRAGEQADPRLAKLLTELGKPDVQGWYRIKERGQL